MHSTISKWIHYKLYLMAFDLNKLTYKYSQFGYFIEHNARKSSYLSRERDRELKKKMEICHAKLNMAASIFFASFLRKKKKHIHTIKW